jgi:HD-like signal output (HDOD) protein
MENKNGTTTMLAASTITPRLQNIVDKIDDLPTLPTVVIKMMELIGKSETSVSELSKLIATDPVLMAKLLKIANSSFYGFPRQISTLDTARGALGFSQLQAWDLVFLLQANSALSRIMISLI